MPRTLATMSFVPEPLTKGRLLVATPPLGDPNFDRTVVYVLDHHAGGAVGVVLNQPTDEADIDGLESWTDQLSPPATLFVGGPVEHDALIGVAIGEGRIDAAWGELTNHIGTIDLELDPDQVAERITCLRIFRGYAGWSPGQLDAEIDLGAWMVFDAQAADVFTSDPDQLWRTVIRRQGGRLAWIANAPDDLSAN
jgi:putative transcriptional regulator